DPSSPRAKLALDILARLTEEGRPSPLGSAESARRKQVILDVLQSAGYEPELESAFVCSSLGACGPVENIVAVREGHAKDEAIVVAAHRDTVGASPGAWDNAAGVAVVLAVAAEIAEMLPPERSIVFLLDDGEEVGLLGATAFAAHHSRMRATKLLINV